MLGSDIKEGTKEPEAQTHELKSLGNPPKPNSPKRIKIQSMQEHLHSSGGGSNGTSLRGYHMIDGSDILGCKTQSMIHELNIELA